MPRAAAVGEGGDFLSAYIVFTLSAIMEVNSNTSKNWFNFGMQVQKKVDPSTFIVCIHVFIGDVPLLEGIYAYF